ncbi:MAG: RDD protein [Anaerolineales bacterium]|nr:RDD protein [Anaerolineales bacterium]
MTANNPPDDYLSISTPENVAFGYDVAGIGSRFLAAVVDTLIILVLQVVVNLTLLALVLSLFRDRLDFDSPVVGWLIAAFGLIAFAFFWGYYIFFEMLWNGQSPGKRWAGLRVIRTDGTPITLAESIVRNLVRIVDFLPAYYGVGVVTMFVNGQSRRLGDLAAGTLVVRDRAAVTLESLAARPAAPLAPALPSAADPASPSPTTPATGWPVERLTSHDLEMAEDFLRRRAQLSNRAALAQRIVQALLKQMNVPPGPMDERQAESVIAEIVQASRNRAT